MQYYYGNYEDYSKVIYKNNLRKDSNRLGILLILFHAFMFGFSFISSIFLVFGLPYDSKSTVQTFLLDGLLSLLVFFVTGLVYIFIVNLDTKVIFPFEKIKASRLAIIVIIGLSVALVSNYASDMLSSVFSAFGIDNSIDFSYNVDSPLSILLYFVTVALVPALVEEFAFRGIILGTLRKYSDTVAIVVSAGLFGLMHGNFVQIPFAFCVGLVLGFVVVKTNSLLPSILIHFFNNAISVFFDILYTNKVLPENVIDYLDCFVTAVIALLSIFFFVKLIRKNKEIFTTKKKDEIMPFRETLKTVCTSPCMIVFACISVLEALLVLVTL